MTNPPEHVLAAWRKACDCCPVCCGKPCDGVTAGGICDAFQCSCTSGRDEDYEQYIFGEDEPV